MKVFVSWSGERGRMFAQAVCALLSAAQGGAAVRPWMSTQIQHGRPWASELLFQLEDSSACVACVTRDTVASHWLAFEAGAVLGAAVDAGRVVCLGLGLSPAMMHGHLLSRFPLLDRSPEGLHALWQVLRPGTEPGWSDEDLRAFARGCAAVPEAPPRDVTVYVAAGESLTIHPVRLDHDIAFDEVVAALLRSLGLDAGPEPRRTLRCLDLDAGRWVDMPWRLSDMGTRRMVIITPEGVGRYQDSDRLATVMLRESIDVIPKVNAALQSLRRDLCDLVVQQQAFRQAQGRYAESLAELDFLPAPGNRIEMVTSPAGLAAVGESELATSLHAVRLGDGAGQFEGQPEGQVFIVRRA